MIEASPDMHLSQTPLLTIATDVSSGRVNITDLAGGSPDQLLQALVLQPSDLRTATTYLVAPLYMSPQIPACMKIQRRFSPHLNLDHIGEMLQAGWPDGLTLGLYRAVGDRCVPPV